MGFQTEPSSSPIADIHRYLRSGYAGGSWSGTDLSSSAAASATARNTALGYAESSAMFGTGGGAFAGVVVDDSAIFIRYTSYGDANLDGLVNARDLYALAANWQLSGKFWFEGDFNYDGTVSTADLNLLAGSWHSGSAALGRALDTLGLPEIHVPEPATTAAATIWATNRGEAGKSRPRVL
ncbi:MAG: hypothetical protein K6U02_12470 [Firmicutes bacterium]|nr:hypothetical protein [Bacillota bacterium]